MNNLFNWTVGLGLLGLIGCTANVNHTFDGNVGITIDGGVDFGADFGEEELTPLAAAVQLTVQTGVPSYINQGAMASQLTGGGMHTVESVTDGACITTDFVNNDGLAPVALDATYEWTLCVYGDGTGTLTAFDDAGAVLDDGDAWDFDIHPNDDSFTISHTEDDRSSYVEDMDMVLGSVFDRNPHAKDYLIATNDDIEPASILGGILGWMIIKIIACSVLDAVGKTDTWFYKKYCQINAFAPN